MSISVIVNVNSICGRKKNKFFVTNFWFVIIQLDLTCAIIFILWFVNFIQFINFTQNQLRIISKMKCKTFFHIISKNHSKLRFSMSSCSMYKIIGSPTSLCHKLFWHLNVTVSKLEESWQSSSIVTKSST